MTYADHPDTPRSRGDMDAPHLSPVTPAEDARTVMINQISWGAVLAGVVLTLAVQLILNLLGVGIGALAAWFGGRLGAVEPTLTGRLMPARRVTTTTPTTTIRS